MKDIFDKINETCRINIEKIKNQTYYTDEQRTEQLARAETKYKKLVKEINNNDLNDNKTKTKLLDTAKHTYEDTYQILIDQERQINDKKKKLAEKIKDITSDKSLSDNEKKKSIATLEAKYKSAINIINQEIELAEEDKLEFIEIEYEKAKTSINEERAKKYNVVNGETVRYGILPEILTELLNKRKDTNKRLEREKDPSLKAVLNGLQLAFKVTANSLYGQTGAPTSPIFFIAIAASTTAIGRERLHYAKKVVEDNFDGAEVIYGDSVLGDTPIIYRDANKDVNIISIQELGDNWSPYDAFKAGESNRRDKQQSIPDDIEVWTANGWATVKRVIRHKTTKKIYRILTHTGCIDVTEDHSLLDKNKNIVKPADCVIGTELLHGFMEANNKYDLMSNTNAFNLGTRTKINNKLIPQDILNSSLEIKRQFLNGYLSFEPADGFTIEVDNKTNAQSLFYLIRALGYNITINNPTNSDVYQLVSNTQPISINNIRDNYFLRTTNPDEYVYDLETADGTFHAGIGELIVKNTDSIFINFHLKDADGNERTDKQALIETIELCQQAAKLINDKVPKPQSIIYEKTLHPFILVAKKKYVGLLFMKDPEKYFMKSMGIVLKRRDNAPIVKIVVGGIIDFILKHRDIDGAVKYTKEVLRKLMDGKYPIEKFIISKNLRGNYKQRKNVKTGQLTSLPAHKILADRMAVRDPGNKPQINDRIPFVYVVKDMGKKKKKDIKQGDLIEHPAYVIEHDLKIDYMYYLEHQIINPAQQILELMLPARKVQRLFNDFLIEEDNKRKGRQSMEKWMDYSTVKPKIKAGSKTSKLPHQSLKQQPNAKPNKSVPYENLHFIGKTKRLECQNMQKWLQHASNKKTSSDEWVPII